VRGENEPHHQKRKHEKIKEPAMSEALPVSLDDSLVMSVAEHVDHSTGIISYTVKGKRLSGSVIVYPRYDNSNETMPSRIFLASDSYKYKTENRRDDILTINGVKIDCWKTFDLKGNEDRSYNDHITRLGSYEWNSLSYNTRTYAHKILDALAALWSKRTDTDDLLHSAAQSNASKRLSEEERRIQNLVTKLDEVRAELDASQERATVYRMLQREYQTKFPAA
jgi:hypothetical protein